MDFRRSRHPPILPCTSEGTAVEVVSSFRYLGVHLKDDLTWSSNTSSLVRKAHQRLYFLRRLRRAGLGRSALITFYRCVVESVLCSCITVWHGSCSAAEKKALQRVVKAAQRTVGSSLPTTTDIFTSRCRKRAILHHERSHPPSTHTVHPPPLRQEATEHQEQDNETEEQLLPWSCQTPELSVAPIALLPPPPQTVLCTCPQYCTQPLHSTLPPEV